MDTNQTKKDILYSYIIYDYSYFLYALQNKIISAMFANQVEIEEINSFHNISMDFKQMCENINIKKAPQTFFINYKSEEIYVPVLIEFKKALSSIFSSRNTNDFKNILINNINTFIHTIFNGYDIEVDNRSFNSVLSYLNNAVCDSIRNLNNDVIPDFINDIYENIDDNDNGTLLPVSKDVPFNTKEEHYSIINELDNLNLEYNKALFKINYELCKIINSKLRKHLIISNKQMMDIQVCVSSNKFDLLLAYTFNKIYLELLEANIDSIQTTDIDTLAELLGGSSYVSKNEIEKALRR